MILVVTLAKLTIFTVYEITRPLDLESDFLLLKIRFFRTISFTTIPVLLRFMYSTRLVVTNRKVLQSALYHRDISFVVSLDIFMSCT